jgi:putative transcriptional regulator
MSDDELTGRLLVATPRLLDPNFRRAVIAVLHHEENGATGVVLNRPSDIAVRRVLPEWKTLATPSLLYHGGPVGPDSAVAIGRVGPDVAAVDEPLGWRRLDALPKDIGLVDLDTPTELVAGVFAALRIYVGYAGWGRGQLEAEIDEGSWYVVDTLASDVFVEPDAAGDTMWRAVLRRQGGELALVSTYPSDPQLN